jgi:hypothetical protein
MYERSWFAAAVILVACKTSGVDEQTVREDLKKADALRTQHVEELRARFAEPSGVTIPEAGAPPCPHVSPRQEPKTEADRKLQRQLAGMQAAARGNLGRVVVVPIDKLGELLPATAIRVANKSEDIANELAKSSIERRSDLATLKRDAAEIADGGAWTYDVIAIVDERQGPTNVRPKEGTFTAGTAVGRSFLYDYQAKAIVCAGRFSVTSGPTVDYAVQGTPVPRDNAAFAAAVDLDAQTMKAAEAALRAVTR